MSTINPYLLFDGNCEEAFLFYQKIFGGDFVVTSRFAEMPESHGQPAVPETMKEKIMHVSLPINDQCALMGFDSLDRVGVHIQVVISRFPSITKARQMQRVSLMVLQ